MGHAVAQLVEALPLYCNCQWAVGVEVWKVATYTAWPFTNSCIHSVGVIVDISEFQFICAFLVLNSFSLNPNTCMHVFCWHTCICLSFWSFLSFCCHAAVILFMKYDQ